MKTLNAIFKLCRNENLTILALSKIVGIHKDRLYRLSHLTESELLDCITVSEMSRITKHFPNFFINY